MDPITRKEMYLAAAAGQDVALPVPVTREEMFLAKMAGQDVSVPAPITRMEMFLNAAAENAGGGAGGGASVAEKDVNFYDYDGTCLYAYSVEEAQALTELPKLPEHSGLICQGWNWSLEDIKAHNRAVNVGAMYITDDGKTRIYITLEEGRTSPMLGVCPNGTVTVDWGDGTEPDVLTGTSTTTVQWTPTHAYAVPNDYIIQLTVDGEMVLSGESGDTAGSYILRHSNMADGRNYTYRNSVRRVEFGEGVTKIGIYAFQNCYALSAVTIPEGVTNIGMYAFQNCYALSAVAIPDGVTKIGDHAFQNCYALSAVTIPDGVTKIDKNVYQKCYALSAVAIPEGVTIIEDYAFQNCYILSAVAIPDGVTNIGMYAFQYCSSLSAVAIPEGVTIIEDYAFQYCCALSAVAIPDGVTKIGRSAFQYCHSVRFFDFSKCTAVPTLSGANAFSQISADCEIRVPAALYDEWIAATNWTTYASNIVAV